MPPTIEIEIKNISHLEYWHVDKRYSDKSLYSPKITTLSNSIYAMVLAFNVNLLYLFSEKGNISDSFLHASMGWGIYIFSHIYGIPV